MGNKAPTVEEGELHRIFDDEADFVYRSLFRLGVREADQSDLLQDVFLVVHRRLSNYDRTRPLRPWLFGICVGLVNNYRRKELRSREHLTDAPPEQTEGATPESILIADRRQSRYRQALDHLSAEKRVTFVMFEVEAIKAKEIAKIQGVPIGTVHSRLNAARHELALFLLEPEAER